MSRTKGAKDKKPRRVAQARIHNGKVSVAVRLYGYTGDMRWFQQLRSAEERGKLVTRVRREIEG